MSTLRASVPDLEALILDHQAAVWRYLRVLGCDPSEADDLTQDVFVRALSGPLEHRGDRSTRSYLLRAARFRYLQLRGKENRLREVAFSEAVDKWFGERCLKDGGNDWLAALHHCTGELKGRQRAALDLFYVEGRSRREIAAQLRMKENGFKTLLQRLRARLRQCVEKELMR